MMKTLLIQVQSEEDYELFLSFARRLNCKVVPTDDWLELDKNDILFTDEMKSELDRRLLHFESNSNETYTMDDVKKELKVQFGREIQTKKRG